MNQYKKIIYLILTIVILILVALNIKVFLDNNFEKKAETGKNEQKNITRNLVSAEEDDANRKDKIAGLNEMLRMQTYFGEYISYIESQNYEAAYSLLYDNFKQTYFPTLEQFETYAKSHYPAMSTIEYTKIDREGKYYVLTYIMRDTLNSNIQDDVKEQRVVIMENDVEDFKLSFDVEE